MKKVKLNVKGGTDTDGFVRLPGESIREDKSYYIVEDICGQFTQKFMEGLIGLSVVNIEHLAKDLIELYKTLSGYKLLPENLNNCFQSTLT